MGLNRLRLVDGGPGSEPGEVDGRRLSNLSTTHRREHRHRVPSGVGRRVDGSLRPSPEGGNRIGGHAGTESWLVVRV